jgi:hypothetical protein
LQLVLHIGTPWQQDMEVVPEPNLARLFVRTSFLAKAQGIAKPFGVFARTVDIDTPVFGCHQELRLSRRT